MPEQGPEEKQTHGKETMASDETGARKLRKMMISRDGWKARANEKQQHIRQLRVNVRDLTESRDYWKSQVKELEQQVKDLQQTNTECLELCSSELPFFGG